ncbi:glycoside hydrolase [Dichomitus squalens]|uniref:Glycoside hydrolase n=1 Tax=Dichomitus squalens TaxID=114155 RepID=A0A4Q9PF62_9APHY|nr:glycoside hydrolase [Dichomitus squalens]TBU53428.1 glycoside hydrolase [Dichomitus squalens]
MKVSAFSVLGCAPALILLKLGCLARGAYVLDGRTLPDDFIFSCGTSAYQIEGATGSQAEGGKGTSIWDTFAHEKGLGHIANDETGDIAVDFYHTYPRDLPLFRQALGVNQFDFTVAWTRILPNGTGTTANPAGLNFYRDVIMTAHRNGMTAACTIYHWDLPQALQDKYGGWLNKQVVSDFRNYAEIIMDGLGDLCDDWLSMNEPRTFCQEGYGADPVSAPAIPNGTFKTEITCRHNAMLAHAEAHEVFVEKKKQGKVKGKFGIKIDGGPGVPMDPTSAADVAAVDRHHAFEFWEVSPLVNGTYNPTMRTALGSLLPSFTAEETKKVAGSYDFVAFDAYTSTWIAALNASDAAACTGEQSDFWPECVEDSETDHAGYLIGKPTESDWNFRANDTIYVGLRYMHENGIKAFTVGENGMAVIKEASLHLGERVVDADRVDWYRSTFKNINWVLDAGLPLIGASFWSCIDNLEWSSGFTIKFGLVDTKPGYNQTRTSKMSANYVKAVMTGELDSRYSYFPSEGI